MLDKREQSIESNEKSYIARLEEQKTSALAAIESGNSENSLKFLCEKMDAEGLWKFIVEHRKDVTALRAELPSALESAIDPARLVLQAIEEDEAAFQFFVCICICRQQKFAGNCCFCFCWPSTLCV